MSVALDRFNEQPALLEEGFGRSMASSLARVDEYLAQAPVAAQQPLGDASFWDEKFAWVRPYSVQNGILMIPVRGVLMNDFPFAYGSYATGYEYITQAILRGLQDGSVKGIALVINSGGGMVSGNWTLVQRIAAWRDVKPIRAIVSEHAYSAAYNIAAATSHISVAQTGGVGSIGVVVVHAEYSKMLKDQGVTLSIIRSKPEKMEGNPYEGLSEAAKERIQERVNALHQQFVAMVAANRNLSESAVDSTNALTFMAAQAVENGLADEVADFDVAMSAFDADLNPHLEGDDHMADISQADHEKALTVAAEAAKAQGFADGAAAATTRLKAILESDEGKARPKAALNAALMMNVPAADVQAFLATMPEEKAEASTEGAGAGAPKGMLQAAMAGTEQPNITGNGSTENLSEEAKAETAKATAYDRAFALFGGKAK